MLGILRFFYVTLVEVSPLPSPNPTGVVATDSDQTVFDVCSGLPDPALPRVRDNALGVR